MKAKLPAPTSATENARFIMLLMLFVACMLWGGGSRLDIPGLAVLQPAVVLLAAAILLTPGPIRFGAIKMPLALLGGLALCMMVQLVPLPPSLWTLLPGHAPFAASAEVAEIPQPWRPISLTPHLTLASLVGLAVPAATLVGLAALPAERTYRLLPYLLAAVGISIVFGLAQLAGGPESAFYRYDVTNEGVAVGVFSNRNHQAVLLAMAFPMLALWTQLPTKDPRYSAVRKWVAIAAALFLLPMLITTGSRAGLGLALVGIAFSWVLVRAGALSEVTTSRKRLIAIAIIVLAFVSLLFAMIAFSRFTAIDRLVSSSVMDDARAGYWPLLVEITRDFFPLGSGFGSFDPVFRFYEPHALLDETYLNHAHNDLIELVLTGGLPALLLLIVFLVWAGRKARLAFRAPIGSRSGGFARLAIAMLAILMLSSLVDYPLRTPLMAALFALACVWLAGAREVAR